MKKLNENAKRILFQSQIKIQIVCADKSYDFIDQFNKLISVLRALSNAKCGLKMFITSLIDYLIVLSQIYHIDLDQSEQLKM